MDIHIFWDGKRCEAFKREFLFSSCFEQNKNTFLYTCKFISQFINLSREQNLKVNLSNREWAQWGRIRTEDKQKIYKINVQIPKINKMNLNKKKNISACFHSKVLAKLK